MVCNKKASATELAQLDKDIASFSRTPNSVSFPTDNDGQTLPVGPERSDEVGRIVEEIHAQANKLLEEVRDMEARAVSHKREHLVSWARNEFPDGDDPDLDGIRLGDKLAESLRYRREAIEAARANKLAKIPIIQEPVHDHKPELNEEELLAMAAQVLAQRATKKG